MGMYKLLTMSLSEKQYDLLNDKSLEVRLHWFCNECNVLAISAVKTDKRNRRKMSPIVFIPTIHRMLVTIWMQPQRKSV